MGGSPGPERPICQHPGVTHWLWVARPAAAAACNPHSAPAAASEAASLSVCTNFRELWIVTSLPSAPVTCSLLTFHSRQSRATGRAQA